MHTIIIYFSVHAGHKRRRNSTATKTHAYSHCPKKKNKKLVKYVVIVCYQTEWSKLELLMCRPLFTDLRLLVMRTETETESI